MCLILPVPFRRDAAGELWAELQACSGFRLWAKHFDPLTVCAPTISADHAASASSFVWRKLSDVDLPESIRFVPLPWGYAPADHLRTMHSVKRILRPLIENSRYLQFAIGGCTFGDWAAVGARLARKTRRAYAAHTDWVAHLVARDRIRGWGILGAWDRLHWRAMRIAERRVVRGASLGLFHGADCYDYFRNNCRNPHLIHNVHVSASELPSELEVAAKCSRVRDRQPLRIVYAGRMVPMKGPDHWLATLAELRDLGVPFEATWLGDGPLHEPMQAEVVRLGLGDCVQLPGFVRERERVLQSLRAADALLFCHLTPESPRVLIEALNQATPILGYDSPYPADLTLHGGGRLTPRGNPQALAAMVAKLDRDRQALATLIRDAANAGKGLTDELVFVHRAELIKQMPYHA